MRSLLLLAIAMMASPVFAQTPGSCQPGTAQRLLNVSNVQASLFNTGGLFFGGSTTSGDGYIVPKVSGNSPMFAAGIWLSGTVNDDIRVTAARYGGYLFRPGPLNADGTLPNASDCSAYDRIYVVNAAEIETYEAGQSPARDLAEWPVGLGAPTVDANGDPVTATSREQVIDLATGERPDLLGSQTAFWVMNDVGSPRSKNHTAPLGIEVQVTAFLISGDALAGTSESSFYRFTVINRSLNTIENARWSFFTDPDLGDAGDDYAGTDTTRGMAFVYNDSNEDAAYGSPPPALGYDILSHGLAATTTLIGAGPDGTQDPITPQEYFNNMQGLWSNGSPVYAFGNGFEQAASGAPITPFSYAGDPVSESAWSEVNVDGNGMDNRDGDRRLFATSALGDLAPGDSAVVDMALLYALGTDYLDSITELRSVSDGVQAAYEAGTLFRRGSDLTVLAAPTLIGPEEGADLAQEDSVTFAWEAVAGATGYQVQWDASADGTFTRSTIVSAPSARLSTDHITSGSGVQTVYWQVTALANGAIGVSSEVRSLNAFRGGVLLLANGNPAYVEVSGPNGDDPCGTGATSTSGCDEGLGNPVYHSLNSTNDYYFSEASGTTTGSETILGQYAPNDFEIRFTEAGSLGIYRFQDGNVIRVPFEIWDIGAVTPGAENDPADDVQLVPVLFADNNGTCAFDAAEIPDGESTFGGFTETDRIYAYYPSSAYADFDAAFAGLVDSAQDNCYPAGTDGADAFIDPTLIRPIQRQVFGSRDTSPALPKTGTVLRMYTVDPPQINPREPVANENAPQLDGPHLADAYPNPGASTIHIPYTLPAAGEIELAVVDVLGREVVELVNTRQLEGAHTAQFDASALAPGVYVVRLQAGDNTRTTRITVAR